MLELAHLGYTVLILIVLGFGIGLIPPRKKKDKGEDKE